MILERIKYWQLAFSIKHISSGTTYPLKWKLLKIKLEEHLWDNIMVGEDQDDDDMDVLGLPGDWSYSFGSSRII